MRSADGASAPSASQTTPAATATQHSKHDQPRQITHHAPPCLSPPVRRTPTTPSQDFRVLTLKMPLAARPDARRSVCAAGQAACPQVSRCIGLSGSDRKYPALTGRSDATGTSSAVAHDGWRLGALVLVTTQRPTHYECVTCVARRIQSP